MGSMSRMLAGGVAGGAKTYLDISEEERAEAGEIRKEKRVGEAQLATEGRAQTIWEKRQARLAEIRGEETTAANLFKRGEREAGEKFTTSEREAGEAEKRQNVKVGYGQAIVDLDKPDEETGQATVKYQAGDKPGTGSGGLGKPMDMKDVVKFLDNKADHTFGVRGTDGNITFHNDEDAHLAARSSSIATRLWKKLDGEVDANTVWAVTYQHIKQQKGEINLEQIEEQLDELDKEMWLWEGQKLEKAELEAAQVAGEATVKTELDLPEGGMLGRNVDDSDNRPGEADVEQTDQTPVGQEIQVPPAMLQGLEEGKIYGMSAGPYKGRRFRFENGRAILVR